RMTLGHLLGLLREGLQRLPLLNKANPLPDAGSPLGDLTRLVSLRIDYVHGGVHSPYLKAEVRRFYAQLVRYAGRTFRLRYRADGVDAPAPLQGTADVLPEAGRVELETGG